MTDTSAEVAQTGVVQPKLSIAQIRSQQNFALATVAGLGAAFAGAVLWAIITFVTNMELGIAAVAIGYLVGQAVRSTGKGIDKKFGYMGGACALLGCIAGNMLSAMAFFAKARGIPFSDVLANLDFDFLQRLGQKSFQAMDLLFYAIAVYEGYRFSFKFRAR